MNKTPFWQHDDNQENGNDYDAVNIGESKSKITITALFLILKTF